MEERFEVTPKGLLLLELGDEKKTEKILCEFSRYLNVIKKNAIVFTKKGKIKFVRVEKTR